MKSIKSVFAIVAAIVTFLAAGVLNQTAAQKKAAPRVTGNAWAQQTASTPQANAAFAAARDLIDAAQWAKAEQAFTQYATKFPREENLDAAMYWTAYAEYQLKKFELCKQTIDKLLKAYEKTSWKQDAELLLAQVPGPPTAKAIAPVAAEIAVISAEAVVAQAEAAVSNANTMVAQSASPQALRIDPAAQERMAAAQERMAEAKARADERTREAQERMQERIQEKLKESEWKFNDNFNYTIGNGMGMGIGLGKGEKLADDDPCEFKIVVLSALAENDPQRGVAAANEWLKPNSGLTSPCRRYALRVLARYGGKPAISTILEVARNDADMKVRQQAISVLGSTNDETVVDPLRDFALNAPQNEINEAAVYALGQHTSPRAVNILADFALSTKPLPLRKTAISRIADRPGEPAVDALFKIYDGSQDVEIRKSVINAFARRKSERAGERLLQLARTGETVEIRKAAISAIGRRSTVVAGTNYIDSLMGLYDSEKDETIKDQILNSLGNSNDQKVIDKLISIAKNPQTPNERKRRIVMLLASKNKNPAVIQFFEELLKQ